MRPAELRRIAQALRTLSELAMSKADIYDETEELLDN
jgi:hypothetical protein